MKAKTAYTSSGRRVRRVISIPMELDNRMTEYSPKANWSAMAAAAFADYLDSCDEGLTKSMKDKLDELKREIVALTHKAERLAFDVYNRDDS